jgi:conjugative transfer signal peptidase TraF
VTLAALGALAKLHGVHINLTSSMPDTFYLAGKGERNSIVTFCSPIPNKALPRGHCPDSSMPLLKQVVAVAGDTVQVTENAVIVNGTALPSSAPLRFGSSGQTLPTVRGIFTIQTGQVWVAGQHPNSFDSRYLGSIPISRIN